MRSRVGPAIALAFAFACGEGRVFDVTGTWQGGLASEHSAYQVMTLQQQDGVISGFICRISSGHRIFRDVPVSGRYPLFTFQYAGDTVTARAESDDLIVASRAGSTAGQWTFVRASFSVYEDCINASP
jgi:hypothetical protein